MFSTVILKGDEEREMQMSKQNLKLKPNIVSLSFDIFNHLIYSVFSVTIMIIYYYLLISLAVKYR